MKKTAVIFTGISLAAAAILTALLNGCTEEKQPEQPPIEVPGMSHFDDARLKFEHSIELRAGETGSIKLALETRAAGPGKFSGRLYHVAGKYGDERTEEIPMPDGLKAYLQPTAFIAWPNWTYRPFIIIKTAAELPPGEYLLCFEHKMENAFSGNAIITVTVKEPEIS